MIFDFIWFQNGKDIVGFCDCVYKRGLMNFYMGYGWDRNNREIILDKVALDIF